MEVRPSDVWVVTQPKCGTTWTQEMVGNIKVYIWNKIRYLPQGLANISAPDLGAGTLLVTWYQPDREGYVEVRLGESTYDDQN